MSLELPLRIINVLRENNITKICDLLQYSSESIGALEGIGKKGIMEIKHTIGRKGLTLND